VIGFISSVRTENDERDAVEASAHVREAPEQHAELERVHQVLNHEQSAGQATHALHYVIRII
jgi:hypothetical protein